MIFGRTGIERELEIATGGRSIATGASGATSCSRGSENAAPTTFAVRRARRSESRATNRVALADRTPYSGVIAAPRRIASNAAPVQYIRRSTTPSANAVPEVGARTTWSGSFRVG